MKTIHDVQDNVNILHTESGFMSFGDDEIIESAPQKLKKSFHCDECPKELATKQRLNSHIMSQHPPALNTPPQEGLTRISDDSPPKKRGPKHKNMKSDLSNGTYFKTSLPFFSDNALIKLVSL